MCHPRLILKFCCARTITVMAILAALLVPAAGADLDAELKKETADAFNTYVQLTEARIHAELQPGQPFLELDRLPEKDKTAALEQLKRGEVFIERKQTLQDGKEIKAPSGMIHHWLGLVFIPGVTLKQTLALQQNYNEHSKIYTPDVNRSKLLNREGNDFQIYYRLRRKKVITVVMDTDYDVKYEPRSPTRETSRVYSTRIQEIENAGMPNEKAKPVGKDSGFMWRLDSYWRMEERDGGVYVQCEAVSLSRNIPTGLGWMIGPFVESVPRESLMFTLGRTREALLNTKQAENSGRH